MQGAKSKYSIKIFVRNTKGIKSFLFFSRLLTWSSVIIIFIKSLAWGFPGGAMVENLPANAGDTGSSPGLGRSHMPRSN